MALQLKQCGPRIGEIRTIVQADFDSPRACSGEVESGSPTRTCANTRIYGVFRSYGDHRVITYERKTL
jgi:hypothetical protein